MPLLIFAAVSLLCASALVTALCARSDRVALGVGTAGAVGGSLLGLGASVTLLLGGETLSARIPWPAPVGELHVGIDSLSAFFLACLFIVSLLAAVYGVGYLPAYAGRRRLAPAIGFSNLLVASMAGILIARDALLFLVAWEAMSISTFFLVTFENDREDVRRAGMTYLIASHLGLVFLFILFGLLAGHGGGLAFERVTAAGALPAGTASACFLLALVGFGTKAGFWPVHVWLPDAHPAAPSHVSALMSGVMIKMGIYGLLRTLTFLGPPSWWWGVAVLAAGAISAIAGVLHALAQHDLKRLLAYSSVENVGVIALGIGVGLLGQSYGQATMSFLGYAGALLHVLNHGLFKGLLFLGAGSVLHATGTRDLGSLGGLARRMPITAATFLAGSVAISGLPPFNGFASEWLIYLSALRSNEGIPVGVTACAVAVVPTLALVGGLAAACFVRAFGVAFLGEPRTDAAAGAHEASWTLRAAMIGSAVLCLGIGLAPASALSLVERPATLLGGLSPVRTEVVASLHSINRMALVLLAVAATLAALRSRLLRGRDVRIAPTWRCGYAAPTARMQYTAASFAEPVLAPFAALLHRRIHSEGPGGYFPPAARYEDQLGDLAGERFLIPLSRRILEALSSIRVIQHGRVQLYIAYIVVTVVALLLWRIGGLSGD